MDELTLNTTANDSETADNGTTSDESPFREIGSPPRRRGRPAGSKKKVITRITAHQTVDSPRTAASSVERMQQEAQEMVELLLLRDLLFSILRGEASKITVQPHGDELMFVVVIPRSSRTEGGSDGHAHQ